MKIAVFGATGFFGHHVIEQGIKQGLGITAFVRKNSDISHLNQLACKIVFIDFSRLPSEFEKLDGFDCLINCIAKPKLHQSLKQHRAVDVDLSKTLFLLASKAGVKRFVQLSTEKVYGFDGDRTNINEHTPLKPTYNFNRIAIEREQVLQHLSGISKTELKILRPSFATGPGDKQVLPGIIKAHKAGFFIVIGSGKNLFSCIDIRDAARALLMLASKQSLQHDIYVVTGETMSWLDVKKLLDNKTGRNSKLLCLPRRLMYLLASVLEFIIPSAVNLPLTRLAVETMTNTNTIDDKRIREEGFHNTYSIRESINDAF